jgi:hypothetical protein
VFDARERAYAGYRDAGRAIDAARVATALAWDYRIFRGEPAVADGWLAADFLPPFRTAAGGYSIENTWRYLVATA